jgi:hypothetical protein
MKIIFRIIPHSTSIDYNYAGAFSFTPAVEADGVSATANSYMLSPLTRICTSVGYDHRVVEKATTRVNRFKKIATLNCLSPKLFLVPKTDGESEVTNLSDELMDAVSEAQVRILNFTHYGFIKEKIPTKEIIQVLIAIKRFRSESLLKTVIWDIDRRYVEEMRLLETHISTNGVP